MITDADIDRLIAAGDHEAAALAAAELVDPVAYRNAMIRAFAASKACKPTANFISGLSTTTGAHDANGME